jgi:hypothetical protein
MLTKEDEAACMSVLDRWMDALNAHDAEAMDGEMRFPHVRLAGGKLERFPASLNRFCLSGVP